MLHTDQPQVPQEMYAARGDVIGTAATADAVSCEPTAITGRSAPMRSATSGRSRPMTVPGSTRSARGGVDPETGRERHIPGAGLHVQQACRRGVGPFGDAGTGEEEGEEVRDEERGVGVVSELVRPELVERVEREELQAVAGVELLERDQGVDLVHAAGGAVVAVVERLGEQLTGTQEAVVDRPRVDADGLDVRFPAHRFREAVEDMGDEGVEVPVQTVGAGHRSVREPRHGLELQDARPHSADHHPTARGAEIHRRDRTDVPYGRGRAVVGHRRNAAATPESTGMCRPVVRLSSGPVST